MGGKNSKVKTGKTGKRGKSKSKKGELEGLSAPEGKYEDGKYEEQATLPRPGLNLDGNSLNVGNGAKLEIVAEGDTSIPNAEVDLETGDISAVSDNVKNSAHTAVNNVQDKAHNMTTAVSSNVDSLAEKSNSVIAETGRISGDFQTSAQAASDRVVETSHNVSDTVTEKVDGLAQMSNNVLEEAGRIAGSFQTSSNAAANNATEASRDVSSSFSQNVDDVAQRSDHALETTGRISGEFQKSAHAPADEVSSSFSENVDEFGEQANANVGKVSSSFSQNVDEFGERANANVGEVSSSFSQKVDAFGERANANVGEVSSSFSQNVDEFGERANANVGEVSSSLAENVEAFGGSANANAAEVSSSVSHSVEAFGRRANTAFEDGQHSIHQGAHEFAEESKSKVSSFITERDGEISQNAGIKLSEDVDIEKKTAAMSKNIDRLVETGESGIAYAQDYTAKTSAAGIAAVGAVSAGAFGSSLESPGQDAAFVKAYDEFLAGSLQQFVASSTEIGGDVAEMGQLTKASFDSQRDFLVMASQSKEPSMDELPPLLAPLSQKIEAVTKYTESHRSSKAFNNLSAVSSGIGGLGWVSVKPTPGPFVKDMMDSSLFYSNKVLKEFRGVNETQVQWCKSLTGIFTELMAYIKQYHTTGVSWNPQGGVASVPGSSPSAGGPPPPPPPPPPPVVESTGPAPSAGGDDRSALFASLNKGEDVTKGLKKVTDDMKTHKNPALRQGPAPFKPNKAPSPISAPKGKATPPVAVKPPKLELEGEKKWIVEYQNGNNNIQITKTSMKQVVYIFKCTQSSIVIKGKVNSVIVDSCKKVGVVVDDVISSIEFVNCQSVQGQITGKAPTVSIDKTDGCMIYLSKESLEANIVTAKSSEMNILVPKDDGEYSEFPIPEQFRTTWNGKELQTEATDIAG